MKILTIISALLFLSTIGLSQIYTPTGGINGSSTSSTYVSIGTNDPLSKLHVHGASDLESKITVRNTSGSSSLELIGKDDGTLGNITWRAGYKFGIYPISAKITAEPVGTLTTSSTPGKLLFYTTPTNSTIPEERMVINEAGNVGINNSNPTTSLQIGTENRALSIGTANYSPNWRAISYVGYNASYDNTTQKWKSLPGTSYNGGAITYTNVSGEFMIAVLPSTGAGVVERTDAEICDLTKFKIRQAGANDFRLRFDGKIECEELEIKDIAGCDFVFEDDYDLRSLYEVEKFISDNQHLPEIASAAEMAEDGVDMGEFQMQLLQKVEELTLYTIGQQKSIDKNNARIEELKKSLVEIKANLNK